MERKSHDRRGEYKVGLQVVELRIRYMYLALEENTTLDARSDTVLRV